MDTELDWKLQVFRWEAAVVGCWRLFHWEGGAWLIILAHRKVLSFHFHLSILPLSLPRQYQANALFQVTCKFPLGRAVPSLKLDLDGCLCSPIHVQHSLTSINVSAYSAGFG